MRTATRITIVHSIAYHRNGVGGAGFHVVLFDDPNHEGPDAPKLLASVFDSPGHVAVVDVNLAAADDIGFGSNSWRGDEYEPDLRRLIAEHEAAQAPISISSGDYVLHYSDKTGEVEEWEVLRIELDGLVLEDDEGGIAYRVDPTTVRKVEG